MTVETLQMLSTVAYVLAGLLRLLQNRRLRRSLGEHGGSLCRRCQLHGGEFLRTRRAAHSRHLWLQSAGGRYLRRELATGSIYGAGLICLIAAGLVLGPDIPDGLAGRSSCYVTDDAADIQQEENRNGRQ